MAPPATILHTESSRGFGGQEQRLVRVAKGLDPGEFRVLIASQPDSQLYLRRDELGLDVRQVSMRSAFDPAAVVRLRGLISREGVSLVHTHSGHDAWLGGLAARFASGNIKVIRTRHLATPIRSTFSYRVLSNMVITVSEGVRRYLVDEKGLVPERVVAVPTGVDPARFDPHKVESSLREELGIPPDAVVLGTVSVLRAAKRHTDLLHALIRARELFPGVRLVICGDGPIRDRIAGEVEELGLSDAVFMLGKRNDVPRVLKGLDIFVHPSRAEALGTAIVEAAAMCLPVVATSVGGIPECVIEGRTGLLVPPFDPGELARALVNLIGDPELRKSFGKSAREMVLARFTEEMMVARTAELYRQVLGEVGP